MPQRSKIIQSMNDFLQIARGLLSDWLNGVLPKVSENWWNECVLASLSAYQRGHVIEQGADSLNELDFVALLRVADRNWYAIRSVVYTSEQKHDVIRELIGMSGNWAHCTESVPIDSAIDADTKTLQKAFEVFDASVDAITQLESFREDALRNAAQPIDVSIQATPAPSNDAITEHAMVCLESDPTTIGVVMSIRRIDDITIYDVFISGAIHTFYDGQLRLVGEKKQASIDANAMRCALTAYSLSNPSGNSLYSLHSAKIDFVPYQFRPALKAIASDRPRLLIADSVGVGKTIEAGLVMKELQARNEIESILIICPKPLVAECKWEDEMKRFDESFTPVDGMLFRRILSDADTYGEWPERYRKIIIPYSLLTDPRYIFGGEEGRRGRAPKNCLLSLDPPPHFDLVIVDEAHHIRHQNTNAYHAVKFFCDNADAVLFLTATPLQTSDDDLYTLLNVLRPDIVLNRDDFDSMSRPNRYLNEALHTMRMAADDWQANALRALGNAVETQWGRSVIKPSPTYSEIRDTLQAQTLSRENRMALIQQVENLNSFSNMITRTRRQDIQDFCIRHSDTIETSFTPEQQVLHDRLMEFEDYALRQLHNTENTRFMMSMLTRQAASCIFGLAPAIKALVNKRLLQIVDDPSFDIDTDSFDKALNIGAGIRARAEELIGLAEALPERDPKLNAFLRVVNDKQVEENNKVIVFSTFRSTLRYLYERLSRCGLRIARMDGSTPDEERHALHQHFRMNKESPEAIDVLLFSEIGSEGLDYQFCDMMINYDLPWNPMRIEQRIGRIDRRGQKSEVVRIVNMITAGTVDADIYYRCLQRINVFEQSVGECAEILGKITAGIEEIVCQRELTGEERRFKLEKLADNEVMRMQELQTLENSERELFGFDFDDFDRQLSAADNPWLSPGAIERLVERYFVTELGAGHYIWGERDHRTLRLSAEKRRRLLDCFRKMKLPHNDVNRGWEMYLKSGQREMPISFDGARAGDENTVLITGAHPLVKAASAALNIEEPYTIGLISSDGSIQPGVYPFAVYAWEHVGFHAKRELVPVCKDAALQCELFSALQGASEFAINASEYRDAWNELERIHLRLWHEAKAKQIEDASADFRFRSQSVTGIYQKRKRACQVQLDNAQYDMQEKIIRMKEAELNNIEIKYRDDMERLRQDAERSDIHIRLLINGVLRVEE